MKKEEKKVEEQVLFPEVVVEGITIKPWSFGMLFKVAPLVDSIIDKIERKGINLDTDSLTLSWPVITKIFVCAADEILKVIAMTIGKPEEEISELGMDSGVKIALTIFKQNSQTIKNAFGLNPMK